MDETANSQPRRRILIASSKVVLTLVALAVGAYALRTVDLHGLARQLRSLPRSTMPLALSVSFVQILALATRLWFVFPGGLRPSWGRVARAFGFGQFANACLPGRAGDVVKVVSLARDSSRSSRGPGVSPAHATGVMLADKALDSITLVGLVSIFAPALLLGVAFGATRRAWIAAAAAGVLVVGGVVARRCWPAAFAKVASYALAAWRALQGVGSPRRLAGALALGTIGWIAEASSMLLTSAGVGAHLSLAQAIAGLLVLNLGIALPVSVANVGVYEGATVLALTPFGLTTTQALAVGALHHIVQITAVLLFALFFWLRGRTEKTPDDPVVISRDAAALPAPAPAE